MRSFWGAPEYELAAGPDQVATWRRFIGREWLSRTRPEGGWRAKITVQGLIPSLGSPPTSLVTTAERPAINRLQTQRIGSVPLMGARRGIAWPSWLWRFLAFLPLYRSVLEITQQQDHLDQHTSSAKGPDGAIATTSQQHGTPGRRGLQLTLASAVWSALRAYHRASLLAGPALAPSHLAAVLDGEARSASLSKNCSP